jgi:hypothetical protein
VQYTLHAKSGPADAMLTFERLSLGEAFFVYTLSEALQIAYF